MKRVVVCLTKYPEIGKVKTRLGNSIGMDKSCSVQKQFIKEIVKNNYSPYLSGRGLGGGYDFLFCLKPKEKINDFSREFSINKKDIFSPNGEDLGELMAYIFEYCFKRYDEVILVGSDIPELNVVDFDLGFNILQNKDIVIGPTFDGGYYLIGMKKENREVFEDIVYSTETVFYETIKKFEDNDLNFGLLEKKRDIDTYEDLVIDSEYNEFLKEIKNKLGDNQLN